MVQTRFIYVVYKHNKLFKRGEHELIGYLHPENLHIRENPMNRWVIEICPDSECPQILMKSLFDTNDAEKMDEWIMNKVGSSIIAPLVFDAGSYGESLPGCCMTETVVIGGSRPANKLNTIASGCIDWSTIDEDIHYWDSCFAVTGTFIMLKKKKNGLYTTFSRQEVIETAADIPECIGTEVPYNIKNKMEEWYRNNCGEE